MQSFPVVLFLLIDLGNLESGNLGLLIFGMKLDESFKESYGFGMIVEPFVERRRVKEGDTRFRFFQVVEAVLSLEAGGIRKIGKRFLSLGHI